MGALEQQLPGRDEAFCSPNTRVGDAVLGLPGLWTLDSVQGAQTERKQVC